MRIIESLTKEKVEKSTETLTLEDGEKVFYDLSKSHMEGEAEEIRRKILESGFEAKVDGMLKGESINTTENRPVMHHLLRDKTILDEVELRLSGNDTQPNNPDNADSVVGRARREIVEELVKIGQFTKAFATSKGITGHTLDTIVSIGIGGSDLGPRMVTDALQCYAVDKQIHFISNVDPSDTLRTFRKINVEKTLFIVISKTFTTIETMENFKLALGLVKSKLRKFSESDICAKHFVAVSSNVEETSKYGIETVFKMWDFVGGRYSLWSAVGLPISLYLGFRWFIELLRGASQADIDFFTRREKSIAFKLAVNELFYISRGFNNKCLVCYDTYLSLMYKYLQQAEMESNGKHGSKQMIIWGGVGTDVQHSFFQLLHQGEADIYLEMLCPVINLSEASEDPAARDNMQKIRSNQQLLVASCFAQTRSMLVGKKSEDLNHHFAGDKPSVTILYSRLTPSTLGAMIATYEHKIFVTGIYFGINSFDQFGVELGKVLTKELVQEIAGVSNEGGDLDESTRKLLNEIK